MAEFSFKQCFSAVGIHNGDSFETARKCYKQKMHRLHPDRFPNDPVKRASTTEQFLKVKKCFKLIEDYYKTYGEMPHIAHDYPNSPELSPASSTKTSQNDSHSREDKRRRNKSKPIQPERDTGARSRGVLDEYEKELFKQACARTDTDTAGGTYRKKASTYQTQPKKKMASAAQICVALVVAGMLTYGIVQVSSGLLFQKMSKSNPLESHSPENLEQLSKELKAEQQRRIELGLDVISIKNSEALPEILEQAEAKVIAIDAQDDLLSEEAEKAKALLFEQQQGAQNQKDDEQTGNTFTFGSSYKQVNSIHGKPDSSKDFTWHYANSKVMFKDGKVIDWESDPSFPLSTRLK